MFFRAKELTVLYLPVERSKDRIVHLFIVKSCFYTRFFLLLVIYELVCCFHEQRCGCLFLVRQTDGRLHFSTNFQGSRQPSHLISYGTLHPLFFIDLWWCSWSRLPSPETNLFLTWGEKRQISQNGEVWSFTDSREIPHRAPSGATLKILAMRGNPVLPIIPEIWRFVILARTYVRQKSLCGVSCFLEVPSSSFLVEFLFVWLFRLTFKKRFMAFGSSGTLILHDAISFVY